MVRTAIVYGVDSSHASNNGACEKGCDLSVLHTRRCPSHELYAIALFVAKALLKTAASAPQDIQAAGGGKAQALGVLTGVYSRQDLEGCGAGVLPVSL